MTSRLAVLDRQLRAAHQILIDCSGALPPFANRPDYQRLSASHVASGEDFIDRGLIIVGTGGNIAALVQGHAQILQHAGMNRMDETHRQQHELSLDLEFAARYFGHALPAVIFAPLQPYDLDRSDLAVLAEEAFGGDRPISFATLLVRA